MPRRCNHFYNCCCRCAVVRLEYSVLQPCKVMQGECERMRVSPCKCACIPSEHANAFEHYVFFFCSVVALIAHLSMSRCINFFFTFSCFHFFPSSLDIYFFLLFSYLFVILFIFRTKRHMKGIFAQKSSKGKYVLHLFQLQME